MEKNTIIGILGILLFVSLAMNIFFLGYNSGRDNDPTPEGTNNKLPKGKVLIQEFSDFECPYCGRVQPTLKLLKQEYGDKIEIEFNHFPLDMHQNAQKASEAAECARDQDKFWEYHDILFENQRNLAVTELKTYAEDLGLDTTKFNNCLESGEKFDIVDADMKQGIANGISGTPGFLINGKLIKAAQPYEEFKKIIDNELE